MRLHRQLLDVIKDELDRRDEREINSVQALLPSYLDFSLQRFAGEQQKMRDAATAAFGLPLAHAERAFGADDIAPPLPIAPPNTPAAWMMRSFRSSILFLEWVTSGQR